jgi:hypothetical protein
LALIVVPFRQFLSFPKFPFSLKPELFIPANRAAIFFPDFARTLSDASFIGMRQRASPLLKFLRQEQYASDRFPVADPSREIPVLVRLRKKAADDVPLIHCALHLSLDDGAARMVQAAFRSKEATPAGGS